jgi:pilus assembly protein CpaE
MLQVSERLDVLGSDGEKLPVNGLTPEGVRIVMEHLQSLYHYTVVDIPTSLASSDPALLAGADTVFVVCDGSLASVRNAARLTRALTPSCKTLHTVINRAGAPGEISMAEIETVLGRRPNLAVPFLPKPFASAAILGKSAISGDRRVRTAIGRLAREISGQEAPRPSLLDRIFRR